MKVVESSQLINFFTLLHWELSFQHMNFVGHILTTPALSMSMIFYNQPLMCLIMQEAHLHQPKF
jgi:hypothetical protein